MKGSPLDEFQGFNFHNVLPGNFMATNKPDDVIMTLLGSCVSACIRCSKTGIGGLNHFLLPSIKGKILKQTDLTTRYGDYAMEKLIGTIIRLGGDRHGLEVKIFGGANLYDTESVKPVGRSNIQFVLDFVHSEGISLLAEDIGGLNGRKIYFHPFTGKVKVQKINKNHQDLKSSETNYGYKLDKGNDDLGTIELFG